MVALAAAAAIASFLGGCAGRKTKAGDSLAYLDVSVDTKRQKKIKTIFQIIMIKMEIKIK